MRKAVGMRSFKQRGGGGGGGGGGGPTCPAGFICSDTTTLWLVGGVVLVGIAGMAWWAAKVQTHTQVPAPAPVPTVYVVQAQAPQSQSGLLQGAKVQVRMNQHIRPDLYPEPVQRLSLGIPGLQTRTTAGPVTQVGILTAEGGSSGSAAPDRTILPLYGRELDARRGRWNYYTRTDGTNPVQVPIRVRNRVCDDDTNGCDEIGSDDSIHVPALGRAFTATVYRKSIFG